MIGAAGRPYHTFMVDIVVIFLYFGHWNLLFVWNLVLVIWNFLMYGRV